MSHTALSLTLLPNRLAICRLAPGADLPAWAMAGEFFAVMRTPEELSIVCSEPSVPTGIQHDTGWRVLKLEGPFPLEMIGVLASAVTPLAEAGVSVFALATYDTDYLLIKESQSAQAITALATSGHTVHTVQEITAL